MGDLSRFLKKNTDMGSASTDHKGGQCAAGGVHRGRSGDRQARYVPPEV